MKAVTGADFCRAIQRKGWVLIRIRGSHQTWEKGSDSVTVPVHKGKDLGRGLLRTLLKQTGLSESEL